MRTCFLRTSPSPTRSTSKRTRAVLIVTKSKKVAPLPKTVISFNEFKEKGNKLYNKGQYSKALEQYVEAYSLLKWIEVRDRTLLSYANIVQKQRAIVDGDIIKRSSYLNSTDDDDTFNDCICSILLSISYCFLQMRHYKNTVDCLDECLEIEQNNVIALFRRSQAWMYNKNSKYGDLEKSLQDIEKVLSIYKGYTVRARRNLDGRRSMTMRAIRSRSYSITC